MQPSTPADTPQPSPDIFARVPLSLLRAIDARDVSDWPEPDKARRWLLTAYAVFQAGRHLWHRQLDAYREGMVDPKTGELPSRERAAVWLGQMERSEVAECVEHGFYPFHFQTERDAVLWALRVAYNARPNWLAGEEGSDWYDRIRGLFESLDAECHDRTPWAMLPVSRLTWPEKWNHAKVWTGIVSAHPGNASPFVLRRTPKAGSGLPSALAARAAGYRAPADVPTSDYPHLLTTSQLRTAVDELEHKGLVRRFPHGRTAYFGLPWQLPEELFEQSVATKVAKKIARRQIAEEVRKKKRVKRGARVGDLVQRELEAARLKGRLRERDQQTRAAQLTAPETLPTPTPSPTEAGRYVEREPGVIYDTLGGRNFYGGRTSPSIIRRRATPVHRGGR